MVSYGMLVRIGKTCGKILLALALVALLGIGAFTVRLMARPIPITWAVPWIERALQGSGLTAALEVHELVLAWDKDTHRIEFTADHVQLNEKAHRLSAVEQASVTLSVLALLHGELQVKDVTLVAPRLQFELGNGTASPVLLSPETNTALAHLHSVTIQRGRIELQHAGSAPDVLDDVHLEWQHGLWSARGAITGTMIFAAAPAPGPVRGELLQDKNGMKLTLHAQNIWPDSVQAVLNNTAPTLLPPSLSLQRLQMPMTIDANFNLTSDGVLTRIATTLSAGAGHIIVPELFSAPLPVQGLQMKSDYDASHGDWHVPNLSASILDTDGPIPVLVSAQGNQLQNTVHIDAAAQNLTVGALKRWWPAGAAPGAYDWLKQNLQAGKIPRAAVSVDLARDAQQNYNVTQAKGGWDLQNITSTFLPHFPPVTGINGTATMDVDTVHFNLRSGQLQDIALQPGTMDIDDLRADDQHLKMNIPMTGQLPTILKLLDTPPYGYAKKYGLNADATNGGVGLRLQISLPLLAALKLSDLQYHALANVAQVSLPGALMNRDISGGQGVFELDPAHMKVDGAAQLAGVPVQFSWQDFFTAPGSPPKNNLSRQVSFSSDMQADDHAKLGLPTAGYVKGPAKLTGTYETRGNQTTLATQMDLTAANVAIQELNYKKSAGAPMAMHAAITSNAADTAGINHLSLNATGPAFGLNGTGTLDAQMNPVKLDFDTLHIGDKTQAHVQFEKRGEQERWTVTGQSLDAGQLLENDSNAPKELTPAAKPPRWISVQLATLYMAHQKEIKNLQAELENTGKNWSKVLLHGDLAPNIPINIHWDSKASGQNLQISTDDAGVALTALGVTESVIGGKLKITGQGNPTAPEWLTQGKIAMTDFRVKGMPLLGRLISAISPNGLLDVFHGEGVTFSRLESQFEYSDAILRLREGKTNGQALGLTFEGDIHHSATPANLSLTGTIVPLYLVNNAIASIPLLGDLVGGNLIAFNYSASGPISNPAVSVNPFSALTPGFLRDLFFDNSAFPAAPDTQNDS